jgi:F-type H+-transporting ATPase subunit delta
MAENSTVARPYAEALFAAAQGSSEVRQTTDERLHLLAELIGLEDVRQAVSDPRLSDADRCALIKKLLKDAPLGDHLYSFIELLIANDRLLLMPEIAQQFSALKDKAEGVAQAHIVSAFAMSDEQVAELVQLLEPKFNLKLKPFVTVDDALIGGVRVVVGDYVLDTSVQAQLSRMRDALVA